MAFGIQPLRQKRVVLTKRKMGKEGKRRLISKLQQEKDQTVAARVVANEAEMADRMTEDERRDRV